MTVTPDTSPPLDQVRNSPAGEQIVGFYLLTKIETRPKRDGAPYLVLELRDSSARMEAKMWEGFEQILENAAPGDVIKIAATVDRYRDIPNLVVSKIRVATEEEAPDRRHFLPHSKLSAEDAAAELTRIIDGIENPHLKELLQQVFSEEEILPGFLESPGGKLWHHATLGGLAEHTLSMATLASMIGTHYPNVNPDLLVAGTLLHDIGKVFELDTQIAIDYAIEGRLIGHIVQGAIYIEKQIDRLEDFPEETRRQLLHLILSHQGDGTMGSPVKPMTLEGIILHYLDEMDSKVNAFEQVRAKTAEGADLSDYQKLMERFFYFRPIEEPSDDGS